MGSVWRAGVTGKDRYSGQVTDAVAKYAAETGRKSLKVLDVGCSTGVAVKSMAGVLGGSGIAVTTTGVEESPGARSRAERNLDDLIPGDIREIKPRPDFDVVLCFKMILFQTPEVRREVLSACAEWLKQDGLLATDAHEKYKVLWPNGPLKTVRGRNRAREYPDAVMDGWEALDRCSRHKFQMAASVMKGCMFLFRF